MPAEAGAGVPAIAQQVLDFWFSASTAQRWFNSTPALDAEIRARFETTWQQAADAELDGWMESPEGCLALAIVLDQFPLNMFRGRAAAFATEARAIEVTLYAVRCGFDHRLAPEQVAFLYMPLMHSENLAHQDEAVRLFETAGLEANARFARHHRDLIRRFGRFPHRNAILGRTSTAAELAYLESKTAFTG